MVPIFLKFPFNPLLNLPFDDLSQFPSQLYSKRYPPKKIREKPDRDLEHVFLFVLTEGGIEEGRGEGGEVVESPKKNSFIS